ncbi:MAG: hypothetical protein SFW62_00425 [Alphaproteobacteria bacterium]|nr:hypothetical protein [Alphaproteobacteria bacterium]
MSDPVRAFTEAAGITELVLPRIPFNLFSAEDNDNGFFSQMLRHLACVIQAVDARKHLSVSTTYLAATEEICLLEVKGRQDKMPLKYQLHVVTPGDAFLRNSDCAGNFYDVQPPMAVLPMDQETLSEDEVESVYRSIGKTLGPYLRGEKSLAPDLR